MAEKKKITPKTSSGKDTVYVDVDDEITNIIDKVKGSEHKIVALVLPKRAAVLQSVVNMKLLKKAAVASKKSIVLITSEHGLLPLAGAAGLHVAKSLQSKPEIPPPPKHADDDAEESMSAPDEIDKTATVGALATAAASKDVDGTETIEFDNVKTDDLPKSVSSKAKKLKHLKVPNFERFRLGFVLAGLGAVLLIVGWILAAMVLPKATITVRTDTTTVVSSFDFTASKDITELDANDKKLPAVLKESKKTDTEKAAATGERDDGTKASGEVTLTAPCATSSITVPTGTRIATGGLEYITQESANINSISGGGPGTWVCSKTVEILSAANGDKYNLEDGKTFTVSGYASVSGKNHDEITGGTSKIVKIVSQKDVDDAVARMNERNGDTAKDELKALIETEEGIMALPETLLTSEPKIVATPAVDKEASETTVTLEVTYSMIGVKKAELEEVIKRDVSGDIDVEKQAITDYGIEAAIMRINNNTTPGNAFLNFRSSVTAGPQFDENSIKEYARGKKRGEIEKYIGDMPGVNAVEVDYSPFWVMSTPKASKKITINIIKASDEQAANSDTNE